MTARSAQVTETPGCAEQVTNPVSRLDCAQNDPGHTGARGPAPHPAPLADSNALPLGAAITVTAFAELGVSPRASVGATSWTRGRDWLCQSPDLPPSHAAQSPHALQQRSYHS